MQIIFTLAEGATGVNEGSRLGLLPQHVKFPSPRGRYKANRRSGARTCEPVCVAVSESPKILSEPVCRAVSESNQIDRCRNEFGMTEKTSSLAREGLRVGLFPARGKAAFATPSPLVTRTVMTVTLAIPAPRGSSVLQIIKLHSLHNKRVINF
ncbi:hypothetical protein IJ579_07930 [bacterium]|nr:hypothetical protein [bacterium]